MKRFMKGMAMNKRDAGMCEMADLLEEGHGSSWINACIAALIQPEEAAQWEAYRMWLVSDDQSAPKPVSPPDYCRSVDAAISLIPEGHDWVVRSESGEAGAVITQGKKLAAFSDGDTPAKALAAAALRARSGIPKGKE